jgi:group II intron reverse transcriptase/maturase
MELLEGKMPGTSRPASVTTKLQQIAELARNAPQMVLTTLAHHIDLEWMKEAHRQTRKDGAAGVDNQTAADYEKELEDNLQSLLDRFKAGTYRAPPVRRVYIPKGDPNAKASRPIGIPTFEDKVLQRAVLMVLEAVYEQDFMSCSYGFRPGRSAHQALDDLWLGLMDVRGGWVIDLDIQNFFDALDRGQLRTFLDQRVRDGVLRRAIDKWLKAGVLEGGTLQHPDAGTPQGGVISPLLANVYLHEVLDRWFEQEVKPRLRGKASLIRYADDAVIGFEREDDAHRVMQVLPKRFGKYGLTVHPEKTRLLDFRWPPSRSDQGGRIGHRHEPQSFDMLGFTHFWGRSLKRNWIVKRKTAKGRFGRAVRRIALWCRKHRHQKVTTQHATLTRKLRGHYAYYGITGNADALNRFRHRVERVWQKWLNRRSARNHMPWPRFKRLLLRYPLPPIRIAHSVYRHAANP